MDEKYAILNIPISEGGIISSHMHNLAESQSYRGLKLLMSDTIFMAMINFMLITIDFKKINMSS